MATPAFAGANFDGNGGCLRHPDVKLTQKMFTGGGKVVYKELMRRCPKCTKQQEKVATTSDSSYATKSQSSSVEQSNSHGSSYRRNNSIISSSSNNTNPHPNLTRSSSRTRSRARSKSRERDTATALPKSPPQSQRSISKPRQSIWGQVPTRDNTPKMVVEGNTSRDNINLPHKKVLDAPFDPKGRCHHHPSISLAKKKLTGGWKV